MLSPRRRIPADTVPRSLAKKIHPPKTLAAIVSHLKRQGRRIVFANGCFDVLHVGHAILLERAKRLGDVLVVAINSDRSVARLKGTGRPIVPQQDRARLLAAFASVDYVTTFDEPTPLRLIARLKPHVLVKGSDWNTSKIVGGDLVRNHGGRVVRIPLVPGYSTTSLIERVRHRRSR